LTLVSAVVLGGMGFVWAWRARPAAPMAGSSAAAAEADGTPGSVTPAPEFPKEVEWLQGGPLKFADLRGKVVVLHFWTNGCVNCVRNYPAYRAWQEKYAGKDVTLVGVHTPEFEREAPAERVRARARANGLKFPIVLDDKARVWKAWGNRYWPTVYLIDRKGRVRYHWEGELHLDTADGKRFAALIDELLAEKP
jgi:peroxiredoxin